MGVLADVGPGAGSCGHGCAGRCSTFCPQSAAICTLVHYSQPRLGILHVKCFVCDCCVDVLAVPWVRGSGSGLDVLDLPQPCHFLSCQGPQRAYSSRATFWLLVWRLSMHVCARLTASPRLNSSDIIGSQVTLHTSAY
jgi:hypothetical protein